MRSLPNIKIGSDVFRKDKAKFKVLKYGEKIGTIVAQRYDTNDVELLNVTNLLSSLETRPVICDLEDLDDSTVARLEKLKDMIESYDAFGPKTREQAAILAGEAAISVHSFYRARRRYDGSLRSLLTGKSSGGRGRARVPAEVEQIVKKCVEELYKSADAANREIVISAAQGECQENGLSVSESTIRRRMNKKPRKKLAEGQFGHNEAENLFGPAAGSYKEAIAPLQVVQIDHTPMDINLVDDGGGVIGGRPWLTVAIDVYSRMILGMYVSFEDPNTGSVAMCIYRSVMPKNDYLKKLGVVSEWPAWGMMRTIHADNGPDFRTKELKLACGEHEMDLQWRPLKNPRYGAHIERLAKTVNDEIKRLAGGIPSDFKQRKHAAPEKAARYTIRDVEQYLATWITMVYHNKLHSSIQCSPLQQYREGLLGGKRPIGLPAIPHNPQQLLLDLTPYQERTVQRHGIEIDHMVYYDGRLAPFILAQDPNHPKLTRKFRCRTPYDDARIIYFQNPDTKEYYKIQCVDRSMPAMTRHELVMINRHLHQKGIRSIDMRAIKKGYKALQELQEKVLARRGKSSQAKSVRRKKAVTDGLKDTHANLMDSSPTPKPDSSESVEFDLKDIPTFKVT